MNGQEASYEAEYPERLNQILIFVKWFMLIPHIIALYILGVVAAIVHFLNWFAVLFTGKTPEGLFNFGLGFERWRARVSAYMFLQTDKYPPFSLDDDPNYPVRVFATRPESVSRWRCLWQWIAAIAGIIIAWFIFFGAFVCYFLAWFAILFTGRYPRGMFNFVSTAIRFGIRLDLYMFLYSTTFPTTNA